MGQCRPNNISRLVDTLLWRMKRPSPAGDPECCCNTQLGYGRSTGTTTTIPVPRSPGYPACSQTAAAFPQLTSLLSKLPYSVSQPYMSGTVSPNGARLREMDFICTLSWAAEYPHVNVYATSTHWGCLIVLVQLRIAVETNSEVCAPQS